MQSDASGKFSLKEFHTVVLRTGNVPPAVLEQVIDEQIEGVRTSSLNGSFSLS